MTTDGLLRVAQVSTAVQGGGAERVARDLHLGLMRRGHDALLVVGSHNRDDPGIVPIPFARTTGLGRVMRGIPARALDPLARRNARAKRVQDLFRHPGAIRRRADRWRGREAFEYPASRTLLELLPWSPDVVHCHNLHGGYFDLRSLPRLARAAPLMLTLHDEWLYTGHCAYTLGCERWRSGCGHCPDLTIYPAVTRDATASNRLIKASIYRDSGFHVSAPSHWLLERARDSILSEGARSFQLIRNGVDRSVFTAVGRAEARDRLGIEPEAKVLLFAANRTRSNRFKDHETVAAAARQIGDTVTDGRVILVSLGEPGPVVRAGRSELWQLGYESEPQRVAYHYRAADLYLHAAHADNAPMTILEALSCGTPVVATAVGGIPELVRSLGGVPGAWSGEAETIESATGVLVPASDPGAMAMAAAMVLQEPDTLARLSRNAIADVEARFTLERQLDVTVDWYREARRLWEVRR